MTITQTDKQALLGEHFDQECQDAVLIPDNEAYLEALRHEASVASGRRQYWIEDRLTHMKPVPVQIMGSGTVPLQIDGRLVTEFTPKRPLPAMSVKSCGSCSNWELRVPIAALPCRDCANPFA